MDGQVLLSVHSHHESRAQLLIWVLVLGAWLLAACTSVCTAPRNSVLTIELQPSRGTAKLIGCVSLWTTKNSCAVKCCLW